MLTTKQLAKLALTDMLAAYNRGELARKDIWYLARGASKYAKAIASGDVADDVVAAVRAECCCEHCPTMTMGEETTLDGEKVVACYCGPRGVDRMEAVIKSCGCLVACSVGGNVIPAGKTLVRSERCPQDRW